MGGRQLGGFVERPTRQRCFARVSYISAVWLKVFPRKSSNAATRGIRRCHNQVQGVISISGTPRTVAGRENGIARRMEANLNKSGHRRLQNEERILPISLRAEKSNHPHSGHRAGFKYESARDQMNHS